MNEPREVFGYCRVSGKSQLDGDGFPRQEEAIRRFAESKGWLVKRIFFEKAVPGKTEMEDREAFMEMLSLTGGVLPSTIIIERADRIARDLIVGELLFRECAKLKLEIFSADSGEELVLSDTADPTRKLLRQVLGAVAEWNKNEIVTKLRKARDRKRVARGRCEGAKPCEELNPVFAPAVQEIMEARQRGDSFHAIARRLNRGPVRAPGGGRWGTSTVHKIFTRKNPCTT